MEPKHLYLVYVILHPKQRLDFIIWSTLNKRQSGRYGRSFSASINNLYTNAGVGECVMFLLQASRKNQGLNVLPY